MFERGYDRYAYGDFGGGLGERVCGKRLVGCGGVDYQGVIMVEVVLVIVRCWLEECCDNGGCLMMM